jgi:hypothetical protein
MLRSYEQAQQGTTNEKRSNAAASQNWERLNRFLTALMRALSAWAV